MTTPQLCLRSNDATLSSNGSYEFQLPNTIKGRYYLRQVSFANTTFPINSNNNTIVYTDNTATRTVNIQPGYYTSTTLLTTLQTAMNAVSGAGYFTITSDPISTIVSFVGTATFTLLFGTYLTKFPSANPETTLALILGFPNKDLTASVSTFTAPGTYVPNLSWNQAYYISLNQKGTDRPTVGFGTTGCNFIIPVSVSQSNLSLALPLYNQYVDFDSTQFLSVRIRDDAGSVVNFQLGLGSWYMVIEKECPSVHALVNELQIIPSATQGGRSGLPRALQPEPGW
jgi:hypothetical protein